MPDSLLATAQHLAAVATLLDSSQLDHIEGRLTALTQKLDAIQDKKKEINEDDDRNRMVRSFNSNILSGLFETRMFFRLTSCMIWLKMEKVSSSCCQKLLSD